MLNLNVRRIAPGLLAAISLVSSGCVYSNGGSFYLAAESGPTWSYTGTAFSPSYAYFRESNQSIYTLTDDQFSITPFLDSSCATAATGTWSTDLSQKNLSRGIAQFSGVKYTWPLSNREGDLYIKVISRDYGVYLCAGPYLIAQAFGGGKCTLTNCTGTGLNGASGAGLDQVVVGGRVNSSGQFTGVGQVRPSGMPSTQAGIGRWQWNPDGSFAGSIANPLTSVGGGSGGTFSDKIYSTVEDSSGRIWGIGETWTAGALSKTTLFRFSDGGTADATLDSSNYYYIYPTNFAGSTDDRGRGMAFDSSGNVIAVGSSRNAAGGYQLVIYRFVVGTNAITPDSTFVSVNGGLTWGASGTAGATGANTADQGQRIIVDSAGRYVVSGLSRSAAGGYHLTVWRALASGQFDTTFGNASGAYVHPSSIGGAPSAATIEDWGTGVAEDSSGRYWIAGRTRNSAGGMFGNLFVARLTSSGQLDTSFASSGIWLVNGTTFFGATAPGGQDDWARSITIASDGGAWVSGYGANASGFYRGAIIKLTSSGALDTSFNSTGYALTTSGTPAGSTGHQAFTHVIDRVGRIWLTGKAWNGAGWDAAVWRFLPNGSADQ